MKPSTFAFAAALVLAASAFAQTPPQNATSRTPAYTVNPQEAAGAPTAPAAQSQQQQGQQGQQPGLLPFQVVDQNGGSLAKAELSGQLQPTGLDMSSVSFFAVPDQKPKLLRKHDLVAILIREDSSFSSVGSDVLQHEADFDAQIVDWIQPRIQHPGLEGYNPNNPLELKTIGSRNNNNQATVDRSDTMTASIEAEVIDVKPNGALVLQATKKIKTDEEEQQLTVTGTCRVEDITADNTVLSTQMTGLAVTKTHKGAVRDTTERGFIPRLLDIFKPF